MAALVEGTQYGLSSSASTSAGLSLTHVKLTDSALRAFEEFLKFKDATSRRPTIQFKAQTGEIRIPVKKSSESTEGYQKFTFSLSTPMFDPKSSFECVQQSSSSGDAPLRSLGTMSHKMSVQATDDVYDRTREQMRIAEEDAKKNRAQEIKLKDRNGRKVVKRVIKKADHHGNQHGNQQHHHSNHKMSSSSSSSSGQKPLSQHSPSVSSYRTSHVTSAATTNFNSIKKSSSSPSSGLGASHRPSHSPSYNKPSSQSSPATSASGKSSPNPAIMNLPYRERVIHLLAIRPFKKPELMLKLSKDGVPEKYKNSLSQVLQQVAQLAKDNSFVLQKHLYSEVRSDWPAYSDHDKELLKRRLQQLEATATPSAGSSPALSPAHSNSSQGSSPSSSHKRPTSTTDEEPPPSKKQRVAHESKRPSPSYNRWNTGDKDKMPSPSTTQHSPSVTTTTPDSTSFNSNVSKTTTPSSNNHHNSSSAYSPVNSVNSSIPSPTKPTLPPMPTANKQHPTSPTKQHNKEHHKEHHKDLNVLTDLSSRQHRNNGSSYHNHHREERVHHPVVSQSVAARNNHKHSSNANRPNNNHNPHHNNNMKPANNKTSSTKSLASSTSEIPDYVLEFTEITSSEQRQKYKTVFNSEYEEYRQLHSDVEKVTRKFKELEASLRQKEEGTDDYEMIKNDIFSQYRIVKKDTSYLKQRRRWDYLHRRLAHIKKLIMAYDSTNIS